MKCSGPVGFLEFSEVFRKMESRIVLLVTFFMLGSSFAQVSELGNYGGDRTQISVSGISAGAAFACQFHVAYSKDVMGVGMVAGLPFYCAGATSTGATACMSSPNMINVDYLVQVTKNTALTGFVDPVSYMQGDKVYIFDGTLDTVVKPAVGPKIEQYYSNFETDTATEFNIAAEHCMPTEDYGNDCPVLASPFLSKCDYNGPFEALNHIYGDLVRPSGSVTLAGDFYEFDQTEFCDSSPSSISMDTTGYAYIPSNCVDSPGCKVHFAFHGCDQGRSEIGSVFVENAGYNEIAELNDIIIVYPQVVTSTFPLNPYGCFDWWGYTSVDYASNIGPQMVTVRRMLDRVLS